MQQSPHFYSSVVARTSINDEAITQALKPGPLFSIAAACLCAQRVCRVSCKAAGDITSECFSKSTNTGEREHGLGYG